jgi:hypothetical protein
MSLTKTTLAGALKAGDHSVAIAAAGTVAVGMVAKIDDEQVEVISVNGTYVELARGVRSAAVDHNAGANFVYGLSTDWTGVNFGPTAVPPRSYSYGAAGAILPLPGLHMLNSGAASAMTLAAPSIGEDGMELNIVAKTDDAYTVTAADGFNVAGTTSDVATFGGAVGDNFTIQALDGRWTVKNLTNVTLG